MAIPTKKETCARARARLALLVVNTTLREELLGAHLFSTLPTRTRVVLPSTVTSDSEASQRTWSHAKTRRQWSSAPANVHAKQCESQQSVHVDHGVPLQLQALKARKAAQCWSQHAWHRATLAGLMQLHQTHFILRKFSRAARAAKLRGARSCFCVDVRPSVLRSTAEVCAVFECASRCEQMLLHTYWYYLRASAWRVGPAAEHVQGRA